MELKDACQFSLIISRFSFTYIKILLGNVGRYERSMK